VQSVTASWEVRVEDFLMRTVAQLAARTSDWLSPRFLLQPAMAAFLAIRGGLRDAKEKPPSLWAARHRPSERARLLRSAWNDIARVTILAFVVDTVYQLVVLRWFYPLQAVLVATLLAIVPYALIRGLVSYVVRRGGAREAAHHRPDARWRRGPIGGAAAAVRREGKL